MRSFLVILIRSTMAFPLRTILSNKPFVHPEAEFPASPESCHGRKDEAKVLLWTCDSFNVKQVIRYGLYPDLEYVRCSLEKRDAKAIDDLLSALFEPHEHEAHAELSHREKVGEILRRSLSPFQRIPWTWLPLPLGHTLSAQAIAEEINTETRLHFSKIAFEDLVRASLGYEAISVKWFLLQHNCFYMYLVQHLQAYPEEIPLYIDVGKHLQPRNPFAHRALVHCLALVQPQEPQASRNQPQSHGPGFEFIAGPIQRLFKDQSSSLATIMKMLSVLGFQFEKQYIHTVVLDWQAPFNTELPFLRDLLDSTSATDLAYSLTSTDVTEFSKLSGQSLVVDNVEVQNLLKNWHSLSSSVWECCSSLPDIVIPYLHECAEVLFNQRSYHSLTAILDGLYRWRISTTQCHDLTSIPEPILSPKITSLIDATNGYAAYLSHYGKYPGIQFLLPHIQVRRQQDEAAISAHFQY
ncbi:hypothetical protein N7523_005712 [Penicillium sp. IBT 18751x]|nr:hypothetical protein N7523_005712 [Penicillium sp. IBT 18751x]